ncbi:MAG TPA: hypothetical protein VGN42_01750 [Pirellulales bacterium]|jgi:hypothetical protein|nr:hypothetical protein [Pirellulales bacterium]
MGILGGSLAGAAFDRFGDPVGNRGARDSAKKSFACVRMAAPYDGQVLPPESAYCQIRCCELSTDGISFYSPVRLGAARFIIRLSERDEPAVLLAARVIDCREDVADDSHRFLVTCAFTKRMQ